jgi:hypothetical protein
LKRGPWQLWKGLEPRRVESGPEKFERLRVEVSSSIAIPAHRDDKGSKRATMVMAKVPASGKGVELTYSRAANIATIVSQLMLGE